MSARMKLNVAYLNGCLLMAVAAGALAGSPAIGLLSFLALAAGGLATGAIRPRRRRPWRDGRPPRRGTCRGGEAAAFLLAMPRPLLHRGRVAGRHRRALMMAERSNSDGFNANDLLLKGSADWLSGQKVPDIDRLVPRVEEATRAYRACRSGSTPPMRLLVSLATTAKASRGSRKVADRIHPACRKPERRMGRIVVRVLGP
ncbi:hypothetical protein EP7_003034 [Isosphaeraceae bacterium EP7]